jgi:DUF1016 N-terminal domain
MKTKRNWFHFYRAILHETDCQIDWSHPANKSVFDHLQECSQKRFWIRIFGQHSRHRCQWLSPPNAARVILFWWHHLIILEQSKRPEEREFYLRVAIRERWSKRELECQFKAALFERAVLSPPRVTPLVAQRAHVPVFLWLSGGSKSWVAGPA